MDIMNGFFFVHAIHLYFTKLCFA